MRLPNIQEKKLNVIEQLIIINDEKVINKVEEVINKSLQRPRLKKFTKRQLINRAKLANKDIKNGNFASQDEIEKLSQKW
jgi:hypothetical protein